MFHDSLHKLDAIINSPQEKIAGRHGIDRHRLGENFSILKFEPVVPGRKWGVGGEGFHCRIPVQYIIAVADF